MPKEEYRGVSCEVTKKILSHRLTSSEHSFLRYFDYEMFSKNSALVDVVLSNVLRETLLSYVEIGKSLKSLTKKGIIRRKKGAGSFFYAYNVDTVPVREKAIILEKSDKVIDEISKRSSKVMNNYKISAQQATDEINNGSYVDWIVGDKKYVITINTPVSKWTKKQFLIYSIYSLRDAIKRFGYKRNPNIYMNIDFGVVTFSEQNEIRGTLKHLCNKGYCHLMHKAYIDWFCENLLKDKLNRIINEKNSQVTFKVFSHSKDIQSFVNYFDLQEKGFIEVSKILSDYVLKKEREDVVETQNDITLEKIEESYRLGVSEVLYDFGIILTANFLLNRGMSKADIEKIIFNELNDIDKSSSIQKKYFKKIIEMTYKNAPYSEDMICLNWKKTFKDTLSGFGREIRKEVEITSLVDFCNYGFLIKVKT